MFIFNKIVCNLIKCGHKQKVEEKLYFVLGEINRNVKYYNFNLFLELMLNKLMLPFVLQQSMSKRNKKKNPLYLRFKKSVRLSLKNFTKSLLLNISLNKLNQKFSKEIHNIFLGRSFSQRNNENVLFYFLDEKALLSRHRFFKKRRRVKFF